MNQQQQILITQRAKLRDICAWKKGHQQKQFNEGIMEFLLVHAVV